VTRFEFTENHHVAFAVGEAARVIAEGGVLLIPTESFYGLGVDPRNRAGVDRVYELKDRPEDVGLPVVCSDWDQIDHLVRLPEAYRPRLGRIWPGALTVVAPCRVRVPACTTDSLAVRIPDHAMLRSLLFRVGPLTATSANRHRGVSPSGVDAALESLVGAPDLVLDAGELPGGLASTIVDLTVEPPLEIRSGPVAWEVPFDPDEWSHLDH
jgi:L-threonylcarbamoyladenylate synthase